MIWIFNKLFGWDYIYWRNSADQGIARVHTSPEGVIYYYRYKLTKVIDVISKKDDVLWVTCESGKYFKSPEERL